MVVLVCLCPWEPYARLSLISRLPAWRASLVGSHHVTVGCQVAIRFWSWGRPWPIR